MSAPTDHQVVTADVVQAIAEEVWTALLGEDEVLLPLPAPLPDDVLSAWVEVVGPWSGAVVLTCGRATAEELTSCLLLRHSPFPPQVEDEDVEDGLGELANVIGGGVKGTLPGPSALSLPQVGATAPRGTEVCRVDAQWRGAALSIVVLDHVQGSATGAAPHDAKNGVSL